ncbi:phage head-tail adapter protein [Acetobacteraceae bacterium]|nr:phage head-tail adapter protein [Acetobacteraceae bacterium]
MTFPLNPMTPKYNPNQSIFAGMSKDDLKNALSKAQKAYIDLSTGKKVVSISYSQGDGGRSVSYTQTNIQQLQALIQQLQRQLGIPGARRAALRPVF